MQSNELKGNPLVSYWCSVLDGKGANGRPMSLHDFLAESVSGRQVHGREQVRLSEIPAQRRETLLMTGGNQAKHCDTNHHRHDQRPQAELKPAAFGGRGHGVSIAVPRR